MAKGHLLYSYYGDDFTGSTDVLQQLASKGVSSVLFLRQPGPEDLARFAGARAIGVAGDSRSRSPEWMDAHLPEIFRSLRAFGAPVCHYKVCSTFDSSPAVGSIGRAIEIGREVFSETPFVPVVVAAPHLRRYVVFGNLFAAGPDGEVVRIDRHPMSRHPVTPMREADLRRHLGQQTALPITLVDLEMVEAGRDFALPQSLEKRSVVLFDGVDRQTQAKVGEVLWRAAGEGVLFSAASSGLTGALVQAWQADGIISKGEVPTERIEERRPLLVMSGSCSLATKLQIEHAIESRFEDISIDPVALLAEGGAAEFREGITRRATQALRNGRSAVLYTALGAPEGEEPHGRALGEALGDLLCELLEQTGVRRVVLCGGDTCSHAVQRLGLLALTWMADVSPGAPLCRAHGGDEHAQGLELVLKGGQVGEDDLLTRVLEAHRGGC